MMKHVAMDKRFVSGLLLMVGWLVMAGCRPENRVVIPVRDELQEPSISVTPTAGIAREDPSTLVLCQSMKEPPTLDPGSPSSARAYSLVYEIAQHIFDRLVRIDQGGKIIPALAVSWEYLQPRLLQLNLRRGVVFHDGKPFNAAAVKSSIERLLGSSGSGRGENFLKTVSGVRALDPYTVQIRTTIPDGLLLRELATLVFIYPPQSLHAGSRSEFGRDPIGTGPFQFHSWEPDRQIVLIRNPRYWAAGVPKLSQLVFRFMPVTDLAGGSWLEPLFLRQLDFIKQFPSRQTLKAKSHPNTKLIKTRSTRYLIIMPNPFRPPFSDLRMRQALALALDKDLLIRLAVNGNGQKIGLLSSDMEFGHNEDLKPYPFDPKRARVLIKEAGYMQGLKVHAVIHPETGPRLGRILSRFLRDVGFQMSENPNDLRSTSDRQPDFWVYVVHNPLMHAAFLPNQFLGERRSLQATNAYPPGFQERYVEMQSNFDLAGQARLCRELEAMAYQTYFVIPLFQLVETYGVARELMYQPSHSGLIDLSEAYFQ